MLEEICQQKVNVDKAEALVALVTDRVGVTDLQISATELRNQYQDLERRVSEKLTCLVDLALLLDEYDIVKRGLIKWLSHFKEECEALLREELRDPNDLDDAMTRLWVSEIKNTRKLKIQPYLI